MQWETNKHQHESMTEKTDKIRKIYKINNGIISKLIMQN